MKNLFIGPFDFNGDGTLDPFELGTEFMIFKECTKEDDEDKEDDWDDEEDAEDDWDDFE